MIPKLAYVSLFGEFNGTWCGPNPLKVTWSLFSIHGELGIGDSRHGGIKRLVGYPSGLCCRRISMEFKQRNITLAEI